MKQIYGLPAELEYLALQTLAKEQKEIDDMMDNAPWDYGDRDFERDYESSLEAQAGTNE